MNIDDRNAGASEAAFPTETTTYRKAAVADLEIEENWRHTQQQGTKYIEFKQPDGTWEKRFYLANSPMVGQAGPAGMGLFAARPFGPNENITTYNGTDLGPVGSVEAEAAQQALVEANAGRPTMVVDRGQGRKVYIDGAGDIRGAWAINSAYMTKWNATTNTYTTDYSKEKATFKNTGTIKVAY